VLLRGAVGLSEAEFKTQAQQTLSDARGWSQLGIAFQQVDSGGDFTLVLSEASMVPSFSSGCDTVWNCNAGRYVIMNNDRWMGASDAWNAAGLGLSTYHHLAINHELGHWLGHDHETCTASGSPAPVMQQQSMDLHGCTFNPWPLTSELWSTTLGIKR
jgi:hypothetical protein